MEPREAPKKLSMGPLQVVQLRDKDGDVVSIDENLDKIVENLEAENAELVCIISVMGSYRTGKSFLLDLLLRYLKTRALQDAKAVEEERTRLEREEWGISEEDLIDDDGAPSTQPAVESRRPRQQSTGMPGSSGDVPGDEVEAHYIGDNVEEHFIGSFCPITYAEEDALRLNGQAAAEESKEPEPAWFHGTDYLHEIPKWVMNGDRSRISEGSKGVDDGVGFAWRPGIDKCTQGIWIYSQPFMFTDADGRRIGVLVMDTQGAWDDKMSRFQSATVFGLTALLSSKLIYNIQNRIDEDKMVNLDYFTTCATNAASACGGSTGAFGHLELLIRDWVEYHDGFDAENCRQQMALHLDDHLNPSKVPKDARDRVERLRNIFASIGCHGLVHPGLKVTRPKYEGEIDAISNDFLQLLDLFVQDIFSENFPKSSAPLGCEISAANFKQVVKNFIDAFAGNCADMTLGLRQANVKLKTLSHREDATKKFKEELYRSIPLTTVLDPDKLEEQGNAMMVRYKRDFLQKIGTFQLPVEERDVEEERYDKDAMQVFGRRRDQNKAALDGAMLKIGLAPIVGFGGFWAVQHSWLLVIGGGLGCALHVNKWASLKRVQPCHPAVATGLVYDYQEWAKNRWKDLQAIRVTLDRFDPVEFQRTMTSGALMVGQAVAGSTSSAAP